LLSKRLQDVSCIVCFGRSIYYRSLGSTQCFFLLRESAVTILCSSAYSCSWAAQRNRAGTETRR